MDKRTMQQYFDLVGPCQTTSIVLNGIIPIALLADRALAMSLFDPFNLFDLFDVLDLLRILKTYFL